MNIIGVIYNVQEDNKTLLGTESIITTGDRRYLTLKFFFSFLFIYMFSYVLLPSHFLSNIASYQFLLFSIYYITISYFY